MHAICFQYKRAHLMTTAYAQRAVHRVEGMTPARYDVLALLRELSMQAGLVDNRHNWMLQRTIVRRLGLAPSTVSKMLRRMQEMGWIRRYRDRSKEGDARTNMVELTDTGLRRAHRAMRHVYRGRLLTTPFERIVRQLHPTLHVTTGLQKTWDSIDAIARYFGDYSRLHYEGGSARGPGCARPNGAYDAHRVGGEAWTFLDDRLARPELSRPMAPHYGDREWQPICERYGFRNPQPTCAGAAEPGGEPCSGGSGHTTMGRVTPGVSGAGRLTRFPRHVHAHHRWRRAAAREAEHAAAREAEGAADPPT